MLSEYKSSYPKLSTHKPKFTSSSGGATGIKPK